MTPNDKESWIRGKEQDMESGLNAPLLNVSNQVGFVTGEWYVKGI